MEGIGGLREPLEDVEEIEHDRSTSRRAETAWAGRTAAAALDIDVAVLAPHPPPPGLLSEMREALEESHVPWAVDVVDLAAADPALRERVLEEGIPWRR
jgi:hypothetical protein